MHSTHDRIRILDLEYKPYLDFVKPFKSDINKQVDYMSIHACITTVHPSSICTIFPPFSEYEDTCLSFQKSPQSRPFHGKL
jgi:hypothetical protein